MVVAFMDRWTTTRRGLVVAAGVGLAGCLGSDDGSSGSDGSDGESDDSSDSLGGIPPGDIEARRERMPDPGVTVDWSDVREFRKWLFDDGNESNGRLEYTETLPDDREFVLSDGFDIEPEQVDGQLSHVDTEILLGSFDAEALETDLEASDAYEISDEYAGYLVVDERADDPVVGTAAVGDDAIVLGSGYERPIDARRGDRDRLEDVDPWITHVFETLPDEPPVSVEYLKPPVGGIDVDEIYCWGASIPDGEDETATWVFVFDRPEDITDDVRSQIEAVAAAVRDSETDGRTLTIEGVPELPDEYE